MRKHKAARFLVRLYPPGWRVRYEQELLALIEQSGLSIARGIDLVVGAVGEWERHIAVRTRVPVLATALIWLVLTLAISGFGTLSAVWLSTHVNTPPITWVENGRTVVLPPKLPGALAVCAAVFPFLVLIRCIVVRPFVWLTAPLARLHVGWIGTARWEKAIGGRELAIWLVGCAIVAVCWQWADLVGNLGTGLPGRPLISVWGRSVVSTMFELELLYLASRIYARSLASTTPPAVPRHVLGLGADDGN